MKNKEDTFVLKAKKELVALFGLVCRLVKKLTTETRRTQRNTEK